MCKSVLLFAALLSLNVGCLFGNDAPSHEQVLKSQVAEEMDQILDDLNSNNHELLLNLNTGFSSFDDTGFVLSTVLMRIAEAKERGYVVYWDEENKTYAARRLRIGEKWEDAPESPWYAAGLFEQLTPRTSKSSHQSR